MAESEESPSERQARIRREKREKKILAGGASRLDKITSVSGRPADIPISTGIESSPSQATPTQASKNQQPISSPAAPQSSEPSQADLEASMRQFLLQGSNNGTPANQQQEEQPQDPMLQLLQQMMGGNMPPMADGTSPAGNNPFEGLPPGLASMLGGMGSGMGQPEAAPAPAAKDIYLWKILHALFSLLLGGYILYTYTTFTGSLTSRLGLPGLQSSPANHDSSLPTDKAVTSQALPLFWLFITAELGLQGGRFLLEGGREEPGMIKTVSGFLPPPWGARLRLIGRYAGIWGTVAQDALVVVFLLGAVAWWRGGGTGLEV